MRGRKGEEVNGREQGRASRASRASHASPYEWIRLAELAEHFFATSFAEASEVNESYEVRSRQNIRPTDEPSCL